MYPAIVDKIIFHRTLYDGCSREPPALAMSKAEAIALQEYLQLFTSYKLKKDDYAVQFFGVDLYIYDL